MEMVGNVKNWWVVTLMALVVVIFVVFWRDSWGLWDWANKWRDHTVALGCW